MVRVGLGWPMQSQILSAPQVSIIGLDRPRPASVATMVGIYRIFRLEAYLIADSVMSYV